MTSLTRRGLAAAITAVAALGWLGTAQAQAYPDKPIKWIVGYPAGGGTDFLARTVAAQLQAQVGQPVVIDNRPGAGAAIGAEATAKAAPDGYTIASADNGVLVYNPVLYKKLAYDPAKDFAPIGMLARVPLLVVAAPQANIRDARQLIDMAKKDPGKLNYGSPGNGSPHHLAMELFKRQAGLQITHVPYKGAAPALQDVMGGQIPLMMVDTAAGLGALRGGKLVPLVVLSAQRLPMLPDVPTAAELGIKDAEAYAWQGLVVPVATPKDVQARLARELQAALANTGVRQKLAEAGWEIVPGDGPQMAAYMAAQNRVWQPLIRELGVTLD